ncbi:hypothetical protein HOE04_03045 [archaeon]|jgi:hypothetical protein|nr:hypothetical protein [archaeon]
MKYELLFGLSMLLFGVGGFFLTGSVLTMTGFSISDVEGGSSSSFVVGVGVVVVGMLMVVFARKLKK